MNEAQLTACILTQALSAEFISHSSARVAYRGLLLTCVCCIINRPKNRQQNTDGRRDSTHDGRLSITHSLEYP